MRSADEQTEPAPAVESMPETLFHYTNAGGLLGILTNRTLWATDFRFLNDEQEATYACETVLDALRFLTHPGLAHGAPEGFGEPYNEYRQALEQHLRSPQFDVYVACLCDADDLLSQWRGYGADNGYAIEFRTDALRHAAMREAGRLARVRYGAAAAADVVASALAVVERDQGLAAKEPRVSAGFTATRLMRRLAAIKHPSFIEEREWRVILNASVAPEFRSTGLAITPYVELLFDPTAIVSVKVGPGRHVDLRMEGVSRLIEERLDGLNPRVLSSGVPLRA